jgi:hypothetical protein
MKAALARFRGRNEDLAPRVSREEAKAKEAKWLQRHNELEAKLHALTRSKDTFEPFETEDESKVAAKQLETRRYREIEDQLRVFKARNDHLEKTNKSLTLLLVEKDALVSRYMNELLTLRSTAERYRPDVAHSSFHAALDDMKTYGVEDVLEEWPASRPNGPIGKDTSGNRPSSSLFEYEESRNSLASWRQSKGSGEGLGRTGTFGQEKEQGKWQAEAEKLRDMLSSAEKELIREKEDKETALESISSLQSQINGLKKEIQTISQLQTDLSQAKSHIKSLESELEQRPSNPFAPAQDPSTMQAIQQLSLMILSKEKAGSVDLQTKSLVQSVFGENFVNMVNAYELKVGKLDEENKELREIYRAELGKHVRDLETLLEIIGELMELIRLAGDEEYEEIAAFLRENEGKYEELQGNTAVSLSETKLLFEEQGVQSLRSSEYSSPIKKSPINTDLDQLRTKLSLQTSENVSLLQKLRSLQGKESQLDRLKRSLGEQKAENSKVTSENEKLKQDLTQAIAANSRLGGTVERLEFRLRTDLDAEDVFTLMQTQAAVLEELINQHATQLEDFDESLDL